MQLASQDGQLRLVVADDGRGFDSAAAAERHYGLRGMRERAQLIGARLEIDASPGAGTSVRLTLAEVG